MSFALGDFQMQRGRRANFAIALSVAALSAVPVLAQETWVIDLGETTLSLDPQVFENHGVWAAVTGEDTGAPEVDEAGRELLAFLVDIDSDFAVGLDEDGVAFFEGSIRHVGGLTVGGPGGKRTLSTFVLISDTSTSPHGFVTAGERGRPGGLILRATNAEIDPAGGVMLITGDDVRLSRPWAAALGRPRLARESIGRFTLRARLVSLDGEEPGELSQSSTTPAGPVAGVGEIGPDLILAYLHNTLSAYGSEGRISAFSVGTTSCNKGDEEALWISTTNQHPVIGQNMYRLKDNRFEHIGMSWLKHGFLALHNNYCLFGCVDPHNGARLGVGCSDPYGAALNGNQSPLGPKWQVNAHTGYFPYPPTRPPLTGSAIERRLQVHDVDLDPTENVGALYFVEGHYVSADEALAGNGNNSAAYAPISISWVSDRYRASVITGIGTQPEQPGIRAWQDSDPAVVETDVQIPGEGLFILAAKVIDQGNGSWRYEYALQNLNSDRSCGSFSVPLPPGAQVFATSFHDVDYHSGEPYDGTDWPAVVSDDEITWQTTDHAVNPNANALRWSTLYSFGFEVNARPGDPRDTTVTLGLFKPDPKEPDTATALTIGPVDVVLDDCNDNGVRDTCDIDCSALGCAPPCGESADCDTNTRPDECQIPVSNGGLCTEGCDPDCNNNGIPDRCDIDDCPDGDLDCQDCQPNNIPDGCEEDCDGDGIPDDCDPPDDCDGDGVDDCLDFCLCTSDPGACVCPELGRCCFPGPFCFSDYEHAACCSGGGAPDCPCDGSPCVGGCMLSEVDGDWDRDGKVDMVDTNELFMCFSGPAEDPGFVEPSVECRTRFDFEFDTDVDQTDYDTFYSLFTGPAP